MFHVSLLKKKIGSNGMVSLTSLVTDESRKIKVNPMAILEIK